MRLKLLTAGLVKSNKKTATRKLLRRSKTFKEEKKIETFLKFS